MVTVENEENEKNNKTIISSIVYSEEDRIKIANTEDLHKILSKILKREDKINQEKEHFRSAHRRVVHRVKLSKRDFMH